MNKSLFLALGAAPLLLASCIQDEKENTECDIEAVSLHVENPSEIFAHVYDTLMTVISTSDDIVFPVNSDAVVQQVPTTLRITEGATAYLKAEDGTETPFLNGSSLDYSDDQVHRFRVVSQDKKWSRNYTLSVKHKAPSDGNLSSGFEEYSLDASGKYYVWNAPDVFMDESGTSTWKNGNPGYRLSMSSAKPLDYPSSPVAGGGPDGSDCVKLETRDTGTFGAWVNMRLASGSLFNGVFDVTSAMTDALKATKFGTPFSHKPLRLRVWLRYEPGSVYQDRLGKPMDNVVDEPDVYVVFFRNEDESGNRVMLDGNDVLTNPYIVGLGRLPHRLNPDGSRILTDDPIHGVTEQWQEFVIPIEYTTGLDAEILKNHGYSLVISFASSWYGGEFCGAIGSKLYLDNMQLICE